jgi:hypothetical protein
VGVLVVTHQAGSALIATPARNSSRDASLKAASGADKLSSCLSPICTNIEVRGRKESSVCLSLSFSKGTSSFLLFSLTRLIFNCLLLIHHPSLLKPFVRWEKKGGKTISTCPITSVSSCPAPPPPPSPRPGLCGREASPVLLRPVLTRVGLHRWRGPGCRFKRDSSVHLPMGRPFVRAEARVIDGATQHSRDQDQEEVDQEGEARSVIALSILNRSIAP